MQKFTHRIYEERAPKQQMADVTDTALGASAAVGLALCAVCALGYAWKTSRRPQMKPSRSDNDLTSILDNSIPSSSALTIRRPPEDPIIVAPSEERYA
jgi:hypothetical protein